MSGDGFGGGMAPLSSYEVLPAHDVVVVPCVGSFDLGWWRALMDVVLADPLWRPGMSFLVDLRHARSALTPSDVDGMSAYVRERHDALRGGRWAVVARGRDEREMARRLGCASAAAHTVIVRPFADDRPAMRWILGGGARN